MTNSNFNKFEMKYRRMANWSAYTIMHIVALTFINFSEIFFQPRHAFIIITLALDFTFLSYVCGRFVYHIFFGYITTIMVMFVHFDYSFSWLPDYCEFAYQSILSLEYPCTISGYAFFLTEYCLGTITNECFGNGTWQMYAYMFVHSVVYFFINLFTVIYIGFVTVAPYLAMTIVLFLPLLSSLIVGFFGNKLGGKYSGYLTSGACGIGAFSAFFLWVLYPTILKNYEMRLYFYFSERYDLFKELAINAWQKVYECRYDPEFAKEWLSYMHKDANVNAVASFGRDRNQALSFKRFHEEDLKKIADIAKDDFEFVINFGRMFKFYSTEANWLFKFDNLALTMAFTILFISFLVHLYSCDYMANDAHATRFFSYLSLFTFFMVMLVLAADMVVFYIAWEGVGLCSFLLISFWFTRVQAVKAALKALLINKIGDVFLLIAAATAFNLTKSLDFSVIFAVAPIAGQKMFFAPAGLRVIDVLCLMLMLASFVKSAQIFFHVWLADAMEGPTPVSALLHAATMVTAGVYLIIRFSFVFEYSAIALSIIVYVGVATTIISGLIGLFQYDIKKIIAYSTCSQLGLMFLACGMSGYTFALYHFFNHAFFKALLFLSAGVIIHALKNEQDIRKMGALRNLFPFTYTAFLIGSLSLVGFPFFSGYFSKDAIIALAYAKYAFNGTNVVLYCFVLFSVFLTCFYSFKLIYYVFLGDSTNISKHLHNAGVKEKLNPFIIAPLYVLSVLSIITGALFKDYFIGLGSNYYYSASVFTLSEEVKYFVFFKEQKIVTLFVLVLGYIMCSVFARYSSDSRFKKLIFHQNRFFWKVFTFFNKKAFFDDVYNLFVSSSVFRFAYATFLSWDKGLLEYFGPHGLYGALRKISLKIKADFNKGPLTFLIKFMVLGVLTLLFVAYLF